MIEVGDDAFGFEWYLVLMAVWYNSLTAPRVVHEYCVVSKMKCMFFSQIYHITSRTREFCISGKTI